MLGPSAHSGRALEHGRPHPGRTRVVLLAALVTGAAYQSGCGSPCDDDPLDCGAGPGFQFAADCDRSGPLDVVLGEGMSDFVPLTADEEPTVHDGAQGGRHLWLGFRVADPALEHPHLQITFDAELSDPSRCAEGEVDCDPWVRTGHRELVVGPTLRLDEDGNVEETGYLVTLSLWPSDLERRLRLTVLDPCRREGRAEHFIPAVSPVEHEPRLGEEETP